MKHYKILGWSTNQVPPHLMTVSIFTAYHDEIKQWCRDHGAPAISSHPQPHSYLMLVDQTYSHMGSLFVDFYDEEMYTMFKLRWG